MKEENTKVPKLSTGDPSTLGSYLKLASLFFGADSKAVEWLENEIAEQGAEEIVLADERQMIQALLVQHKEEP